MTSYRKMGNSPGFSLTECLIALAVLGASLMVISGLFSRTMVRYSIARERERVLQCIPAVAGWLKFEQRRTENPADAPQPFFGEETGELFLVCDANGHEWRRLDAEPSGKKDPGYYLFTIVDCQELPQGIKEDLEWVRILKVRVEWPFRVPASGGFREIPAENRCRFEYLTTLRK